MKRTAALAIVLVSSLMIVTAFLLLLGEPASFALPDSGVLYVAPGGNCGGASPCYANVQAAVDAAGEDDTIKVATGVYTGVSARESITQVVYISKTVTVQGGYTTTDWNTADPSANPTTLDALGQGRVLLVAGGNPTIEGLHLTGGYAYGRSAVPLASSTASDENIGYGGGVRLYSSATLSGNVIYSNTAAGAIGGRGGGVSLCCNAALIRNTLYGNTALGGSYTGGGGVFVGGGAPVLVGNIIRDNVAGGGGGGVYGGDDFYSDSYAMLIGNTVVRNSAGHGGGVYLGTRGVSLINNVIAQNQADLGGSGIYIRGGDYRLINNTVAENTGAEGAGVCVDSYGGHIGTVTMVNTIVAHQQVGLYVVGVSTATVDGVLWYGNSANTGGPGTILVNHAVTGDPVFVDPANGDYHIHPASAAVNRGVPIDYPVDMDGQYRFLAAPPDLGADEVATAPTPQCRAQLNGSGPIHSTIQAAIDASISATDTVKVSGVCMGAVMWNGSASVAVLTKTLTLRGGYNSDFSVWDPNVYPTILYGDFRKRGLGVAPSVSPTVEYLTLFAGRAAEGGGLWSAGYGTTLRHLQVLYNLAASGGGLALHGEGGRVEWSRVSGNRAELGGGGVYVYGSTTTLSNNTFTENASGFAGGGIYLDSSGATLERNAVNDNMAFWYGGGVYVINSPVTLDTNTFFGNMADVGGGMHIQSSDSMLNGNLVSSNLARQVGGGLYLSGGHPLLRRNTIIANSALADTNSDDGGGGVYAHDSAATISENTINSNSARGSGGGMLLSCFQSGNPTLVSNTVAFNAARFGGGLHLVSCPAVLDQNTISGNVASSSGGGLYLVGSDAVLTGNKISGNRAETSYPTSGGGGLELVESAAALTANIISGNVARGSGGGMYVYESNASLLNNVVMDNQAGYFGSGLLVMAASPWLTHTTMARNWGGDGSAVHVTAYPSSSFSHVSLVNSILVSHTVGITISANSAADLNGVLWFSNGANTGGPGVVTVTHAITGDPAFAADGYHITPGSAAFDAGVDAGVTTDIDGEHRPYALAPDLGVDELVAAYAAPGVETTLVYTDTHGLTTTVRMPTGAVTETTLLVYTPVDQVPSLGGFAFAHHAFDLEAYRGGSHLPGLVFNRPVTVTTRYSDEDVRVITDENQLYLGWWTGTGWPDVAATCGLTGTAALAAYVRDPVNNVVGVPVCHLSRFAWFGPTWQVYLPLIMRGY